MQVNKIHLQDCVGGLEHIAALKSESFDLTITSPPYKDEDGFSKKLIQDVAFYLNKCHKKNTLCFVNFGHLAGFKSRPFQVVQALVLMGWTLGETFTWVKNHYKPIQGKRRVNNLTEFVFMFYKGKMPELDRLSIGVPYKDISNAKRFSGGRNLRCRGNAWEIPYKTINSSKDKLHNDRFPIELPEMCIKLANLKAGSVIVDPFAGSGTTLLAAKNLGHNYIGFEKNSEHHATATKRLA